MLNSELITSKAVSYITYMGDKNERKSPYVYWLAAFRHEINKRHRGFQKELAEKLNKSTVHINDVIKGRKRASLELQDEIARALGYTYDEMIRMGRDITGAEGIKKEEPFVGYHKIMSLTFDQRPEAIIRAAAESVGLVAYAMNPEDAVKSFKQDIPYDDYVRGEIDELTLFERAKEFFEHIKATLEKALKSWAGHEGATGKR